MTPHPFDNEFNVTPGQKEQFARDGFVKLDGFLNANVVTALRRRTDVAMGRGTVDNLKEDSWISRTVYDFGSDANEIYELLERRYFRQALTELTGRDLFNISEQAFEIEKNVSKGLPWHVGVQVFGYLFPRDLGCTIWAPLQRAGASGQGGGMAYVPQHVVSGEFIFEQIEPAVVSAFQAKDRAGVRTTVDEYFTVRNGVLNSPAMCEILENHSVADDFEPGDVLLFNKNVVHRSIMLGEGPLPRRAAYVLRFVDAESRYNLPGARYVNFPVEQYGKGLFAYKPMTRQHMEIAEAGAEHGDCLSECAYFSDRSRRMVRHLGREGGEH